MELTGKIILDDTTINELRNQIREEVIEDIKKNGLYLSEAEEILRYCKLNEYVGVVARTIIDVLGNITEEDIRFTSDVKNKYILLAISNILKI